MKRTLTAIGAAAVLGLGISVAAQSPAPAQRNMDEKEITITGCLEKNKSGGYWLTNAMTSAKMSPQGTSGTAPASSSTDKTTMDAMNWNLEGGKDLDKHVGHKIEVTGHAKNDVSGDQPKSATDDKEQKARDFDVKSMKMIASSCS